ncbi:MAG: hypothetical protein IKT14_01970, partial [Clostridiales bacterium]|nr:hypothetical protein [Clostridiales bacterium]
MANRNRNKGYYRLLLSPGPPGIMVFFQIILAFLIIGVPIFLTIGIAVVLQITGHTGTTSKIIVAFIGVALVFLWAVIVGKLPKLPSLKDKKNLYYFNIEDAHKFVDMEKLKDSDKMDGLAMNGAICFNKEADDHFLDYIYNLFRDYKLLTKERLTVYSLTDEDFLSHFTYYEKDFYNYGTLYLIPIEELTTDIESFKKLSRK